MDPVVVYGALLEKIKNTPVSGDISVDSVTLSKNPVEDMQVTPKKFVEDLVAGGVEVVVVDGAQVFVVGHTVYVDTNQES